MRIITMGTVSSSLNMFDGYIDTQTETADQISQPFDVSGNNAVVCLNNYGVSANLTVTDDDTSTVIYNETISLHRSGIKDWWDYYFGPIRIGRDLVWYFPTTANATAVITIDYAGGIAKCGLCLPGTAEIVGHTQWNGKMGITDYSIIDTNDFGLTYLTPGDWAKRGDMDVYIANTDMDSTYNRVIQNRALSSCFDFNEYDFTDTGTSIDGTQAYILYGFVESFSHSLKSPGINSASFEIQGVI